MCGITGWIDWDIDFTNQLQYQKIISSMAETLIPRGPDERGFRFSPHAAFAHRRLVVVDPAGGSQPMCRTYGENTYTLIYNGELYNTSELREQLIQRGHQFHSHSDTEVLLISFVEWGPSCVERFNGIFAFAIWDEKEQRLFMARDRLGVKPLFYTLRGNSLLFASELKSLLAHPDIKPTLDLEGLSEILVMGPARTPGHGIFQNIVELKPGHFLIYHRDGVHIKPYWNLISQPHVDSFETTVEKVRELFRDTVERQLVADVPVCTLLSGGLDSSVITAIAHEFFQHNGMGPLHTYTVDYVDNDRYFKPNEFQPNADSEWIAKVTDFLGTTPHTILIDNQNLVESLKDAVLARDLPGMADVDSSLLLFCEGIKSEATVALSGECADEVFGGYPWFRRPDLYNLNTFPWTRNLSSRIGLLNPDLIHQIQPESYMDRRYREALEEVPKLPGETGHEARMREMFYLNLTRWMPTLLDRKDRMSMAVGLEVRVPFCDHRLVEYLWNVPWEMKYHNQIEKGLLREAMNGILPQDVLYRKKSPYPKTHNPAYLAATCHWVLEILEDANSPLQSLVNPQKVRELAQLASPDLHLPWFGQLMNLPQLFAFLGQLDTWMRQFKVTIV